MRKEKYEAARQLGPIATQLDRAIEAHAGARSERERQYVDVMRSLRGDARALGALEQLRLERVAAAKVSRWDRYLNVPHYLWRATKTAQRVGLAAYTGGSMVDIGSGPCFLGYTARTVCEIEAIGIDLPEQPGDIAWRVARALGQTIIAHRIEPYQPIPNLGRRFNVATIIAPQFYRKADGRFWTAVEWGDLFGQIFSRYLVPGGELVLRINANKRGNGSDMYDHADVVKAVERVPGSRRDDWFFSMPRPA